MDLFSTISFRLDAEIDFPQVVQQIDQSQFSYVPVPCSSELTFHRAGITAEKG